jgi:hypothetical protein
MVMGKATHSGPRFLVFQHEGLRYVVDILSVGYVLVYEGYTYPDNDKIWLLEWLEHRFEVKTEQLIFRIEADARDLHNKFVEMQELLQGEG